MKIKFILSFFFALLATIAFSQIDDDVEIIEFEDDSLEIYEYYDLMVLPEFRIGASPSAVFNGFPALQLSFDYRLNDISEVSLETGFIMGSSLSGKGFRARASYELFIHRGEHVGFFVGAAVTSVNVWEFVQYQIEYEETYFREHVGFQRRNMIGGFATGGMKIHLGQGVMMELSSGIGLTNFYTSTLVEGLNRNFGQNTLLPSRPGWTPFPGYYNNINISVPVNLDPARIKYREFKANRKSPSKSKKKKRKKKKRNRRR